MVHLVGIRNELRHSFIDAYNRRNVYVANQYIEACELSHRSHFVADNANLLLSFPQRSLQSRLTGLSLSPWKAHLSAMNSCVCRALDQRKVNASRSEEHTSELQS